MKKAILLSVLALTLSAHAQDDMAGSDAGTSTPATPATSEEIRQIKLPNMPPQVQFKDLSNQWRRFTLETQDANYVQHYGHQWGPAYEQVLNDLGIGVHFTKGDSFLIGKENYLIAYRVDPGMNAQELQQEIQNRMQAFFGGGHGGPPAPTRPTGKFSPRAVLKLALLNLRNVGDLKDLRTFDPKRDLLGPADLRMLSDANLQQVGNFMRQFHQNWGMNQALPVGSMQALRQMLQNYFHANVNILRDPASGAEYGINTALAGKQSARIGNKKALPMVFEAAPSSDGTRGVLFLDGHIERVPEWKWNAVRAVKIQGPSPREWRALSNTRLTTIGRYLIAYASEGYDETFRLPNTKDFKTARRALMNNFGHQPHLYQHPETGVTYRFNPAIALVELRKVSNSKDVVAAFEPGAASDGTRGAVFLDGRVRRIPEARWKSTLAVKPKLGKTVFNRAARVYAG